jgi:hypothetical protein
MRFGTWIISLLALLTLAGCSPLSVVSDYDTAVPFGSYRSYRWASDGKSVPDGDLFAGNPLIYKRVRSSVDRELQAKGFLLRETGPVDFTVATHAGTRERVAVTTAPAFSFSYGRGYHRRGHGYYSAIWYDPFASYQSLTYYEEETLFIDIFDANTGEMAWRGVASGIMRSFDTTGGTRRDLDEAVAKIMAKFPPPTK